MVGQEHFKSRMYDLFQDNKFPRFVILAGLRGQGKKFMANWIADKLGGQKYVLPDTKVETVRDMIQTVYKQRTQTVVILPDADSMSNAARNALLKVTEEPPNNAYFIMTLQSLTNTLDTIKSRATIYTLDLYSYFELEKYLDFVKAVDTEDKRLILNVAITPGDINLLIKYNIKEFYNYVEKVMCHIATVSGANAFKIADKVAIKEDGEGYPLEMFLLIFMKMCLQHLSDGDDGNWMGAIVQTQQAFDSLNIKGINRQYVMDSWILGVRKEWM